MTPWSRAQLAQLLHTWRAGGVEHYDIGAFDHESGRMSLRGPWTLHQVMQEDVGMSAPPTENQETTSPVSQTKARDDRRGQLIGECWLGKWIEEGRKSDNERAASWLAPCRAAEERDYEWMWVPPYLQSEADDEIDRYRGQRAGAVILEALAHTAHPAGGYCFGLASEHAVKTDEQWLFLAGIMEFDGWREAEMTDEAGQEFLVWTKVPPPTT